MEEYAVYILRVRVRKLKENCVSSPIVEKKKCRDKIWNNKVVSYSFYYNTLFIKRDSLYVYSPTSVGSARAMFFFFPFPQMMKV